jgi:hypothetical protein
MRTQSLIYGVFNEVFNRSDNAASNGTAVNKYRTAEDVDGSNRGSWQPLPSNAVKTATEITRRYDSDF